jgi:glycine/D-amino acid oxidase-like deaminating enzyme
MKRRSFLHLTGAGALGARLPVQSTTTAPEVIVIGAGAFGGWTAFYLREMGARVTLLDAYGPGNARASSGGETRLLRADYGEQELYTRLALRAFPLWRRWQEEWGAKLLLPSGRLLMARAEGMANLKERQARLAKHNFKTEILRHDELKYRWPQVNYEDIAGGIYDTASGILKAREACRVVAEQFRQRGGTMKIAHAQPGTVANGEMQGLRLAGGETLRASLYVFACGPWLRKVFPALLGKRLRTPRRDVFFIGTPPGDDRFDWRGMPSWGFGGPSNDPEFSKWYGFPAVDERGLKACPVDDNNQIDPDTDERIVSAYQLKRAHDYLGWRFPALRQQPIVETRVCQTENSVDDNFIVTPHPDMKNVWIAGGGSGHGFKHGPAFGQYLANRLLGRGSEPEFDQAFTLKKETF